jgi:hypothetical protein
VATFVDSPSCATAFVNLHLPVVAVGRNCERVRERGGRHHSAQHSNQKNIYHFSLHGTPFCFISMTDHPANLFMARALDFAVPLGGCSPFSVSGEFFPTFPYLIFVTRRQAGSLRRYLIIKQLRYSGVASIKLLTMRKEFRLVDLPRSRAVLYPHSSVDVIGKPGTQEALYPISCFPLFLIQRLPVSFV